MAKFRGYFTGIGSRGTPKDKLKWLEKASGLLADMGFTLRSGHAMGADRACELGADGNAVIYLPWPGYGIKPYKDDGGMDIIGEGFIPGNDNKWPKHQQMIRWICEKMGRNWDLMKRGPKALLFRNTFQVVGHDRMASGEEAIVPSDLLICCHYYKGGTMYAVRMADHYGVPIINVADYRDYRKLELAILAVAVEIQSKKGAANVR